MSAPRTNVSTESRRHRGPLIGMAVVVLLVMGMFGYWMFDEASNGQPQTTTSLPDGPPASEGDGAAVETTGTDTTPGAVTTGPSLSTDPAGGPAAVTPSTQPTEAAPQSDGETLPTQQDVTPDPATVQE